MIEEESMFLSLQRNSTNARSVSVWSILSFSAAFIVTILLPQPRNGYGQTANTSGICNFTARNNRNANLRSQYCSTLGVPKPELIDPPELWLGTNLKLAESLLAARNPVIIPASGGTIIESHGTLLGLPGVTRYGFNSSDKLEWISAENQCTEEKYDYTFSKKPPDLDPSQLEWDESWDHNLSYETTIDCPTILGVMQLAQEFIGDPSNQRQFNKLGELPSPDYICGSMESMAQSCTKVGAERTIYLSEFVSTNRLIEANLTIRKLEMYGDVQRGSYSPNERRREMVGIVTVGELGTHPDFEPRIYGPFHFYLGP